MSTIKKIDAISVPAVENSLALFDLPPSIVSYNKTYQKELLPLNTITRDGPYTFRLYSDSNFIDLSRTYMQLKVSIEKKLGGDWVPIADENDDDKNTSIIQNFNQSFIKQLKISINSVEVYNSTVLYPFLCYINREFFASYDLNAGLVGSTGYYTDRGDRKLQNDPTNFGFVNRKKLFAKGREGVTFSHLNFDLGNQPRLLLPNSDIIFTIYSSSDRFLILAPNYNKMIQPPALEGAKVGDPLPAPYAQVTANGTDYRIKVHDIRLYCTLVDVVQSLQNSIAKQLEHVPAKYPIRRIEMRHQYLPEGLTNLSYNCFQSIIPRRVLVFFLNNKAFDGDPEQSPFNFINANVQSISIEAGGLTVPSVSYHLDFSEGSSDFFRSYWDFHTGIGMEDVTLELLPVEYANTGYCGFCFDLRSFNRELGDAFELVKNSTTVLKVQLSNPVEEPGLQVLVLGEFDSVITINADRIISTDGSI
jgi:hypothetical protein